MPRPPLDIDPAEVERLASWGTPINEMADFFMCHPNTLTQRFSEIIAKGRANLKNTLRQKQIEVAKGGNVVMLIWLGKQMLGQIDRQQLDLAKIPDELLVEEAKKRLANNEQQDT